MSDKQTQRPRWLAGSDLTGLERAFAVALGLAVLAFDFYQWNEHGPSTLGLAVFVFGAVLVLIGILWPAFLSRISRLDISPSGRVSIQTVPDTLGRQVEESATAAAVGKEPTQQDGGEEVAHTVSDSDTAEARPESPFSQAIDAYMDRDYARFDKLMQEAVSEASEEDERVQYESVRLGWLHNAGHADKLDQLEAFRREHVTSPHPVRQLAVCYARVGEHLAAAKLYGEGYQIEALTEEERLAFLGQQATALREAGRPEEAEGLLRNELQRVGNAKAEVSLHRHLAQLYDPWGKKAQMHWHLEKVFEASPGDAGTRFKLAYSYAQNGHPHAAFYHYDVIAFANPTARNNMAVALEGFAMPITAAAYYRYAVDQKETLAAGNLAITMIGAGLVDEAGHLLDEAQQEGEVHARVHYAATQLASKKSEEEKRLKKIREGAKAERQLLRDRVDAERSSTISVKPDNVVGTWKTSVGSMTFGLQDGKLVARFKDGYWNWVLKGAVGGRTYLFQWKCDQPGQNKEGDGFFLFASDDRFEGLIRHTPQEGEVRPVSGSGKEHSDARPTSQPSEGILAEFLRSQGQQDRDRSA